MTRSGFGSAAWLGEQGLLLDSGDGSLALFRGQFKRLFPLVCTPPWALHSDVHGTREAQQNLRTLLRDQAPMLAVVDLGPRALDCLAPPAGWIEVLRHTRQTRLLKDREPPCPSTRLKQERRFLREGGSVQVASGEAQAWSKVARLHQAARSRKGLPHHGTRLEELLNRLAPESWSFVCLALGPDGACLASGGFVVLEDGTCVYAFGGQQRSSNSGRASVAMLLAAMRHAQELGCERFDFGGSQDSGVDQFYAEFGAEVVPMRRWIKAPWWFAWVFQSTWDAWTRPTRHA
jgi:hypothetical protein